MRLDDVYAWVGNRLLTAGAPPVTVPTPWLFRQQAPDGAGYPHVVVMVQGAQDLTAIGPKRVAGNGTLSIRCTDEDADWSDSQALLDWIDALVQTAPGAGGTAPWTGAVRASTRQGTYDYLETFEGRQYAHLVATYELITA